MIFLLIYSIFSFNHPIKDIIIGDWSVQLHEIVSEDNLEINHSYHIQFLEYESFSVIGDFIKNLNNSKTELITTVKIDFSNLIAIIWTGSLQYFYKLIRIEFIKSRNQMFYAQGKFIDGIGDYIISIYSPQRIDITIYEKGKVSYFSLEKKIHSVPYLWMSKYIYFLPVTILLIITTLLPCEKEQQQKVVKIKTD